MKKPLIIFFAACLLQISNSAQGQTVNECRAFASYLQDSLKFPMMMSDNDVEAKLIVRFYADSLSDSPAVSFLRKSKLEFLNRSTEKHLRGAAAETKPAATGCECFFNIDFKTLYTDSTHTTYFDTLLVSSDSVAHLFSQRSNDVYTVLIEEGRPFISTLDSIYHLYITGYVPSPAAEEEKEFEMRKEYGLRNLKSLKDSIAIRIWVINELAYAPSNIYWLGINSKGKEYAKAYSIGSWEKLNIDSNVLTQSIIPSLIRFPSQLKYPRYILDGTSYHVEVWYNKIYRHYSLGNPASIAHYYRFWRDREFMSIMSRITNR